MYLYVTDGTVFAGFQVAHDAHFADCKTWEKHLKHHREPRSAQTWLWAVAFNLLQHVEHARHKGSRHCCSHECRHSMIVVASMKYPPHRTHMRWGLSSVIFILVVRCIVKETNNNPACVCGGGETSQKGASKAGEEEADDSVYGPFGKERCLFDCVKATSSSTLI